jgi:hypothetical protein
MPPHNDQIVLVQVVHLLTDKVAKNEKKSVSHLFGKNIFEGAGHHLSKPALCQQN